MNQVINRSFTVSRTLCKRSQSASHEAATDVETALYKLVIWFFI